MYKYTHWRLTGVTELQAEALPILRWRPKKQHLAVCIYSALGLLHPLNNAGASEFVNLASLSYVSWYLVYIHIRKGKFRDTKNSIFQRYEVCAVVDCCFYYVTGLISLWSICVSVSSRCNGWVLLVNWNSAGSWGSFPVGEGQAVLSCSVKCDGVRV